MNMYKEDCIFCKLANGDIPARTVYEDDGFRVILDLSPISRGHSLILPKAHMEDIYELSADTAQKIMPLAQKMAMRLRDKLGCDGLNLLQNNGESAGQTISHFHLHMIPRYKGEGNALHFHPQEATAEELNEVLDQLTQ
jgi:histidine triad (HIT) family protein